MLVQIENLPGDQTGEPADFHLFETKFGKHLFIVDGSRIYTIPAELERLLRVPDPDVPAIFREAGLAAPPYIGDDDPLLDPPLRTISLAIAQACNLGCVYCYAQQGTFGGKAKAMTRDVALAAVDLLLAEAATGDRVQIAYLGGEPLANRSLLRETSNYALNLAARKGVKAGFSITTNGTLLTDEDAEFFEQHGFAVTISLDGMSETHDRLRPFKDGRGSFQQILSRVRPLIERQKRMEVSARVTVTPHNLDLRPLLDALIAMGFHSVGFSPMLSSPTGEAQLEAQHLRIMLNQMIECGSEFERRVEEGERYPFANMLNALGELHRGTHRPYPCGAGAGYMGVSAEGGLYSCHRFVADEAGAMGDVKLGIHREKRNQWLATRHVHSQEPCRSCWARYLCGGGCHHEVIRRGRPACDYIRGWLDYCLGAYIRILEKNPGFFAA
jgi:uncharacterized protein